MKYGVNRVNLVGNVVDEPRVSQREWETFVFYFPLATKNIVLEISPLQLRSRWLKFRDLTIQHAIAEYPFVLPDSVCIIIK